MRSQVNGVRTLFNRPSIAMVALLCVVMGLPAYSGLESGALAGSRAFMAITVTNNSAREIYHLYLSPVDRDAWGPDLMSEGTVLKTGQSYTINDVSCSANEIKVVAEDKEGCFMYGVVSCAQASTSWTIAADTPRDCGN